MTVAEALFGTLMIAMLALGTSRLVERRFEDQLRGQALSRALGLADEVRRHARGGGACSEVRTLLSSSRMPGLWRWRFAPEERAETAPAWVLFTPVASPEPGFPVYVGSCRVGLGG